MPPPVLGNSERAGLGRVKNVIFNSFISCTVSLNCHIKMASSIVEARLTGIFLLRDGGIPQQLKTCSPTWKNTPTKFLCPSIKG